MTMMRVFLSQIFCVCASVFVMPRASRGAGGPASITRQTSELLAENGASINGVVIRRRGGIGEDADGGPVETDPLGLTQSDLRSFCAGNDRMQRQRERKYRDKGKQRKFNYGTSYTTHKHFQIIVPVPPMPDFLFLRGCFYWNGRCFGVSIGKSTRQCTEPCESRI